MSRDDIVDHLLSFANVDASRAIFPKRSFMVEFMMSMALEEMHMSGCTCFKTR